MKYACFFLLLFCLNACRLKNQLVSDSVHTEAATDTVRYKPLLYFQFEKEQYRKEQKQGPFFYDATGRAFFQQTLAWADLLSPVGGCWTTARNEKRQQLSLGNLNPALPAKLSHFTIEIALKFDPDSMNYFNMGFHESQITIGPGQIWFSITDASGAVDRTNSLQIDNDGRAGLTEYLYDGGWHHYCFLFDGDTAAKTGMLRVFIDGKTSAAFSKKTTTAYSYTGKNFTVSFLPNIRSRKNSMDELAIWTETLPAAFIFQHSSDFFSGHHYRENFTARDLPNGPLPVFKMDARVYNPLDFAPGFPAYTVSQEQQLETFPLPRFRPGNQLHRNFSWFDFMFMSYDYSVVTKGNKGQFLYPGMKQAGHAQAAIDMNVEMYRHWNYYYNIPTPTYNANDFSKPGTFAGRIAAYADTHPEMPVCTYVFWVGIQPKGAGFESASPYIKNMASINPCTNDSTYPDIRKDGLTQRRNLRKLVNALPHRDSLNKIDFVSENGEVFGPVWTPNAEGYRGNPVIRCIQQDSATARSQRAHWQYQVFSVYRNQFIANDSFPALKKTQFSFYQVSGMMPNYYSEWTEMRGINSAHPQHPYSTPDFYPGMKKWNIWETHGPYHGLDVIKDARMYEISNGDTYFSPFVCAGWFEDSTNFRPAEWLAAMKALSMMGAEYFYPAYFTTGDPGKMKPQDPRGYIYQVAMPVYAQAITSRYETIFERSRYFVYERNYNKLVIYRKDRTQPVYAITAAVFPGTNYAGSGGEVVSGNVSIDHDLLKINFREQGSTYIYDKTDPEHIVFYQLDGWHEDKHPYYWSRNFDFEAELHDDSNRVHLRTEQPPGVAPGNYTHFTTYVYFTSNAEAQQPLQFNFEPRASDTAVYYIWVRARSSSPNGSGLKLAIDEEPAYEVKDVSPEAFRWYCVSVKGKPVKVSVTAGQEHHLFLSGTDRFIEIDRVVLSTVAVPDFVGTSR